MAQSEILGLFGGSPQQVRNEYLSSNRLTPAQIGSQGLLQQVASMGRNAGAEVGTALGGLFGGAAPGEREAMQMQESLAQVNQMNLPSTYEKYKALSGLLAQKGQGGASMAMAAKAEELKPKAPEATKLARLMQEQSKFPKGSTQWNAFQGAINKETKAAEGAKSALEKKMDLAGITDPAERQSIAKQSLELELKANQGDPTAIAAFNLLNKQLDAQMKQQKIAQSEKEATAAEAAGVKKNKADAFKAAGIIGTIDTALSQVSGTTAGLGGSVMSKLSGSEAVDLNANLETIQANLGFDQLQAMRDASPTGGALGQVSERELLALQSTVASLRQDQSPEQLRENIEKVKKHYQNWLDTLNGINPDERDAKEAKAKVAQTNRIIPNAEDITLIQKHLKR